MLSENVRQARDISVPASAEAKLTKKTILGNFSYSPLSSDEVLLPSLSPAQPMQLPPLIKARIRAAAKEAKTTEKALRFREERATGKLTNIRDAKSKGMKGFLKRTFDMEPLYSDAFP